MKYYQLIILMYFNNFFSLNTKLNNLNYILDKTASEYAMNA